MNFRAVVLVLAALVLAPAAFADQSAMPYAGQQTRAIKALSDDEIAAFLNGEGMGFAKAAELNGYPGPAHVLTLAQKLKAHLPTASSGPSDFRPDECRSKAARRGARPA